MTVGSERGTVQNPLIRYAEEAGWHYLSPKEALRLRRGKEGLVLHDILVHQLQRLNPGVVDLTRAEELIRRLTAIRPSIEGNLEAWEYLAGLKTVYVEEERREQNVCFLDPERVEADTFHVTDEFTFVSGTHTLSLIHI